MGFKGTEKYKGSVKKTFKFFTDPDQITARFKAGGDTDIEILRCEEDGDGFIIETKRITEVDLPGFATKVLKPKNTMTQVERWDPPAKDGSRHATFTIEVGGAPVKTNGTIDLTPDGKGSRQTVDGEIAVKVPVVGKKIASFASKTAQERLEADLAFNKAELG